MSKLSRSNLSSNARRIRWLILGICSAPLVGTYFYNQGYKVTFLVCPIRHFTGIPCPTCGMTRSFMAIVRGDWSCALAEHLFGPVLFAAFLIATVHITLELIAGRKIAVLYVQMLRNRKLQVLSLLLILSYHALRLYYLSKSGELYLALVHSPLGQLFF
ncbi:DUF2752 domain-containing protein [Trichocoleus sp. DQ-A3]|uniref:DUF2752 domain-containing protein n=1 Tax=Cyanophyceae TaxID=3028117 RepID=UPI0018EF7C89|nr:DUF2752 domain-containing protein [Coleofasciculus sp. FACHB-125]